MLLLWLKLLLIISITVIINEGPRASPTSSRPTEAEIREKEKTEKNIKDKWGPVDYEYQPQQVLIIANNIKDFSINNMSYDKTNINILVNRAGDKSNEGKVGDKSNEGKGKKGDQEHPDDDDEQVLPLLP